MGRHPRRERGFTLTELLATMGVVGVSLAMVVPGFDTVVANNRRATTINQLITTMHAARSEAITRNSRVSICPSTNGTSCTGTDWNEGWIFFTDSPTGVPPAFGTVDGDDEVLGRGTGHPKLTITSQEFDEFLTYRPNGRVVANTTDDKLDQFVFCDQQDPERPNFARVLLVSPSGEPRVSETQLDGDAPDCGDGA